MLRLRDRGRRAIACTARVHGRNIGLYPRCSFASSTGGSSAARAGEAEARGDKFGDSGSAARNNETDEEAGPGAAETSHSAAMAGFRAVLNGYTAAQSTISHPAREYTTGGTRDPPPHVGVAPEAQLPPPRVPIDEAKTAREISAELKWAALNGVKPEDGGDAALSPATAAAADDVSVDRQLARLDKLSAETRSLQRRAARSALRLSETRNPSDKLRGTAAADAEAAAAAQKEMAQLQLTLKPVLAKKKAKKAAAAGASVGELKERLKTHRKWARTTRAQAAKAQAAAALPHASEQTKQMAKSLADAADLAAKELEAVSELYTAALGESGDKEAIKALSDAEIEEAESDDASPSFDEVDEIAREQSKPQDVYESQCDATMAAADVHVQYVPPPRDAKVARLRAKLQRVLFMPGVHYLRDPRTGVWNYPKELADIPKPEEFAAHRLPEYITASQDEELASMSEAEGIRYVGSTSTLTQSFAQIWFTLNGGRGVDTSSLSQKWADETQSYTVGAQLPAAIVAKRLPNGRYAIDNDKQYDVNENILSDYGRILEKALTSEDDEFQRFLMSSPESAVPDAERKEREAYAYSRGTKLLMRSQLDCQDNRLPGSGTFDIKTRACLPIRHDRANYEANQVYDISATVGTFGTFEREYYDLTRSGMLKYCFQARIGLMDGIFLAYHNTVRCFGFQYLPRTELDERLFGSSDVGDQVFSLCVGMFERILDMATGFFPDEDVSLTLSHNKAVRRTRNELVVTVQPTVWERPDPKPLRSIRIQMVNLLDGVEVPAGDGIDFFSEDAEERARQKWTVRYNVAVTPAEFEGQVAAFKAFDHATQQLKAMTSLPVPEGSTPSEMKLQRIERLRRERLKLEHAEAELHGSDGAAGVGAAGDGAANNAAEPTYAQVKWVDAPKHIKFLRARTKQLGDEYDQRRAQWNPDIEVLSSHEPEPARAAKK